jgi:hypothetical protein
VIKFVISGGSGGVLDLQWGGRIYGQRL